MSQLPFLYTLISFPFISSYHLKKYVFLLNYIYSGWCTTFLKTHSWFFHCHFSLQHNMYVMTPPDASSDVSLEEDVPVPGTSGGETAEGSEVWGLWIQARWSCHKESNQMSSWIRVGRLRYSCNRTAWGFWWESIQLQLVSNEEEELPFPPNPRPLKVEKRQEQQRSARLLMQWQPCPPPQWAASEAGYLAQDRRGTVLGTCQFPGCVCSCARDSCLEIWILDLFLPMGVLWPSGLWFLDLLFVLWTWLYGLVLILWTGLDTVDLPCLELIEGVLFVGKGNFWEILIQSWNKNS